MVTAHGEVHDKMVALGMHQQGLRPGQIHLYGAVSVVDGQSSQMLDGHVLLAAKPAANQCVLHLDLFRAQQQLALVEGLAGWSVE